MDGVDVWANTLAQLMAKRKPQDTWELVPEENLASGHLDSRGFQYRLRGLARCAGGGLLQGSGREGPPAQPLGEDGSLVGLALGPNGWMGGLSAPCPFWEWLLGEQSLFTAF